MGRPYAKELAELSDTYGWAATADIPGLQSAVSRAASLPLVAVGSGGSLTTAHVMAQLHRRIAGSLAAVTTPLHLEAALPHDRRAAVWLLSAGGRNVDIRAALRVAAEGEPRQLAVLCGAPESPLVRDALLRSWVNVANAPLPTRDGFLATNSALAFSVLLCRAYLALVGRKLAHATLDALLAATHRQQAVLAERCAPLWKRSTTILLHGASTAPAAFDLESRFTEAALGLVQLADFRNFAHGRHHWLAKHPKTTGVLALVAPEDAALAGATLKVLPKEVPSVALDFTGTSEELLLGSIVAAMHVAAAAGVARRIDPGRPGVPRFGSRLYHMKVRSKTLRGQEAISPQDEAAISRKLRSTTSALRSNGALNDWKTAVVAARARVTSAIYGAIVCDYDGTLVESAQREKPPSQEVVAALARLLKAGVIVGIATGRGDSVTVALRESLPKHTWKKVIVGYHNGAHVRGLDQEADLPTAGPASSLKRAADALAADLALRGRARIRAAADQVTVSPSFGIGEEDLWLAVAETVRREGLDDLRVVRSSHSVDVMPTTSSKLRVVDAVTRLLSTDLAVLALGDRGCWPGNDYELLSSPHALSVDEVSPDPTTGWNFCPKGERGVGGASYYFRGISAKAGRFRLTLEGRDS